MGWWVLKHRRHEGPFTEEALHQELRKGRFRAEDYALSGDDLDAGRLEYVPLMRVLQIKAPETSSEAPPPLVPVETSEVRAASSAENTAAQIQASFAALPVNPASLAGFEAADFVPGVSKSRLRRTSSSTLGGVSMTVTSTATTATGTFATDPTPVAPKAAKGSLPRPVRMALVIAIAGALAWMAFDKLKNATPEVAGAKRPASTTRAQPDIPTVVRKTRTDKSRSLRLPEAPDTRDRDPMPMPGSSPSMPMADLNSAPPPPDTLPAPQDPPYNTGFAGPAGDAVPPPPPAAEYDAQPAAPPPPSSPDGMPGLPEAAE